MFLKFHDMKNVPEAGFLLVIHSTGNQPTEYYPMKSQQTLQLAGNWHSCKMVLTLLEFLKYRKYLFLVNR